MSNRRFFPVLLFPFLFSIPSQAQSSYGIITTIAGNGTAGYSGDGGIATSASINKPWDIAVDDNGNVYFSDQDNNRVRKISPNGIITTIAGDGTAAYGGDGGPAVMAQINRPRGMAVDKDGNVYVGEYNSFRVRKIDGAGIITTVAGTGIFNTNGDGGPAVQAEIGQPNDVAFDPVGNMYIVDGFEHVVRKVDTNGIITSFAGTGLIGSGPYNVPANTSHINNLTSIAFDGLGNAYIADQYPSVIYKVDAAGILTWIAGDGQLQSDGDGGPLLQASFHNPAGLYADSIGNLYITDVLGYKIRRIDLSGNVSTFAGTGQQGFAGDGGAAINAELRPHSMTVDKWGRIFIADWENNRIRMIDTAQVPNSVRNIQADAKEIAVYPNPSSGTFEINTTSKIREEGTLTIVNVAGQEVKRIEVVTGGKQKIAFDGAAGTYYLMIRCKENNWLGKMVIVHE